MTAADELFIAQMSLAKGYFYLFKIEKKLFVGPKGGEKWVPQKPKLVTSLWEIEAYLMGLVDESYDPHDNDPAATYYYIVTKDPQNAAIDSLQDRAYGRASATIDLQSTDGSMARKTIVINMPQIKTASQVKKDVRSKQ